MGVFTWSVWNGAKYYIDVFGMRFSKELEELKRDVAKWQSTPDLMGKSSLTSPDQEKTNPMVASPPAESSIQVLQKNSMGEASEASEVSEVSEKESTSLERNGSISQITSLDETAKGSGTGADIASDKSGMKERKSTEPSIDVSS
jgi:hypothetical protein